MSALAACWAAVTVLLLGRRPVGRGRWSARPPEPGQRVTALSARVRWGGSFSAAAGLAVATGWWWVLGLVPLVAWALGRWVPVDTSRERAALVAGLPLALELLAACLRSGLPLRRAAAIVSEAVGGEVGRRLAGVVAAVRVGTDEAEAWRALAAEDVLAPVARDLARAVGSGTALAASLERHTADARKEQRARVLERAKAVGVRSVLPLMVCFLPAFILVGVVPIVAGVVVRLLG